MIVNTEWNSVNEQNQFQSVNSVVRMENLGRLLLDDLMGLRGSVGRVYDRRNVVGFGEYQLGQAGVSRLQKMSLIG
jgi:hypothetical protein